MQLGDIFILTNFLRSFECNFVLHVSCLALCCFMSRALLMSLPLSRFGKSKREHDVNEAANKKHRWKKKKYCMDVSPSYKNVLCKMSSNQDADKIYVPIAECILNGCHN